jgi:hypothetical protein
MQKNKTKILTTTSVLLGSVIVAYIFQGSNVLVKINKEMETVLDNDLQNHYQNLFFLLLLLFASSFLG